MPMSADFRERLVPNLQTITDVFDTPFHLYDRKGIEQTALKLLSAVGNNLFAVKALLNLEILKILQGLGMGFDCSSSAELKLAVMAGAKPGQIMLTSNNTSCQLFAEARDYGAVINFDDISLMDKVKPLPELVSFRYNPGKRRAGLESVIGRPESCKYGVPHEQIVQAYSLARQQGANRFGLHTMLVSNELNWRCFAETVRMLLEVAETISSELGIKFEFLNFGGGLGIPYRLAEQPFDLNSLESEMRRLVDLFATKQAYQPKLYMECGRYVTGPHGVLVTRCVSRKHGYQEFCGVDCSAFAAMMRPPMYYPQGGYHHISVYDYRGQKKEGRSAHPISVVGPACEDRERFCWSREDLPEIEIGDLVVIEDTGAHCWSMGSTYNGWPRPQELLLTADNSVELIRRAETVEDLFATLNYQPQTLQLIAGKKSWAA